MEHLGLGTLSKTKNTLQSKALTNKIAWFATPDTSLQSGPEMAAFLGTVYRERFELRSKWDQLWAQESQVPRIKSFDIFWNHLKAGKAKHDQLYQDRITWSHVALITWSKCRKPNHQPPCLEDFTHFTHKNSNFGDCWACWLNTTITAMELSTRWPKACRFQHFRPVVILFWLPGAPSQETGCDEYENSIWGRGISLNSTDK